MILSTGLINTAMEVLFDDSTPRENGLQGVAFDVTSMILNNNNTASFSLSLTWGVSNGKETSNGQNPRNLLP